MHIVIDEGATSYSGIFMKASSTKVMYLTIITAPAKSVQPHLDPGDRNIFWHIRHVFAAPSTTELVRQEDCKTSILFYLTWTLYVLSTTIIALDSTARFTGEVKSSENSAPTNNNLFLSNFQIVMTTYPWRNETLLIPNVNTPSPYLIDLIIENKKTSYENCPKDEV